MLEERYPEESWIQVYTDGSATDAVKCGGAGVHIQYPNGERQAEAIPTGLHCTNYKAEVEALKHAANIISTRVDNSSQVVFLIDALSVLQAFNAGKLKNLYSLNTLRTELQWIPSHCGIEGNEKADKMAKMGARKEQENNPVSLAEMTTINYQVPF